MQLAAATPIGNVNTAKHKSGLFDLSTPSGWAMVYWLVAVAIIGVLFVTA